MVVVLITEIRLMGVQMVILSHLFSGSNKKRALVDSANSMLEIQKFSSSSGVDDPSTSLDCVGSNGNESKKNVPEKSHGFNTAYCEETEPQFEANTCYCLRSQVVSFIWAVIRSIVPTELLGTPYDWRMLRRNIAMFIQLRRFENNQVQKCATGESVEMHKGSRRLDDAACVLRHKLLSCLVDHWCKQTSVTETEQGSQDLYYYRKSVWEKLINNAVTYLKDLGYRDLDDVKLGCPNKYESSLCH
ncbi:telomerase reverse transcriptase [Quercus suber]|uniref:Telomerase reverse transcriptase n=1 Tax=Quercus suber TaxID=58331 RepID=A0AAW0K952_QUESU